MNVLSPLGRKKGVSNMVAYAMLISITILLSTFVYSWLRFYVGENEVPECSEKIDVVIQDYDCVKGFATGHLSVTIKNKGLFSVDGYVLRVNDRVGSEIGFYDVRQENSTVNPASFPLKPGEVYSIPQVGFNESSNHHKDFQTMTFIEVQPYVIDGGKVSCRSVSSQKIDCVVA